MFMEATALDQYGEMFLNIIEIYIHISQKVGVFEFLETTILFRIELGK